MTAHAKAAVIDTDVFVHLFNDAVNLENHIGTLLAHLRKRRFRLCVDDQGKIMQEYLARLLPVVRGASERGVERQMIQYWMRQEVQDEVPVDLKGALLSCVTGILPPKPCGKDRFFVATAAGKPCNLVTNDRKHILANRATLRKRTRKWHGGKMDILSSKDALGAYAAG